ncbi:MAG: 2-C-methyl-D-erythritol 4-phosphate cytidylyltransferase [candidate division WOR-3 bacterium]|nr:MAG: 2-C-methyl-D-erythritol 4-phosphate cytidylyltransferase [candidate division WOR-3 bacterium]
MALLLTCRNFLLLFAVPNIAIIVAAGQGRRFGGMKQFMTFRGMPLFLHSLLAFEACRNIAEIVLAVPRLKIASVRRTVRNAGITKVHTIVAGGSRRQDSVKNALSAVSQTRGIVAVHDAVRPVITVPMINKGIRLCRQHRAVVFGVPVSDTMKYVKDHVISRTIPRDNVFTVQTPQFFSLDLLRQAFDHTGTNHEFTDEAALLERQGIKVHLFPGDPRNIKVTTRQDLSLIDRML